MHKHRSRSVGHPETQGNPVGGTKKLFPLISPENKEIQVTVKCVRMTEEMINSAAKMAEDALRQNTTRKDVAAYVKKGFDEKYGPLWHCIVGKDFGSYVTHQEQGFIVFRVEDWAFLLFSTRHNVPKCHGTKGLPLKESPQSIEFHNAVMVTVVPTKHMCVEAFTNFLPLGRFAVRAMKITLAVGIIKSVNFKEASGKVTESAQ